MARIVADFGRQLTKYGHVWTMGLDCGCTLDVDERLAMYGRSAVLDELTRMADDHRCGQVRPDWDGSLQDQMRRARYLVDAPLPVTKKPEPIKKEEPEKPKPDRFDLIEID